MITIKRSGKKPHFYELDILFPVFSNFKVKIVISDDTTSTSRYVADRDYLAEPVIADHSEAFTLSSPSGGYSLVYLTPNSKLGTVAHECYHATKALMKFVGSPGEDGEFVAYHLGYLVDLAVEFNLKVADRFETKAKREAAQKIKSDRAKSFERRQK